MRNSTFVLLLPVALAAVRPAAAATRGWQAGETAAKEASQRLATGASHTCVALYDGSVRCWGLNSSGQLGNGGTVNSSVPVTVERRIGLFDSPLSLAVAVAVGDNFSCALIADGTVKCWGGNASGQLGDLSTVDKTRAVTVAGIANAVRIAAGQFHACALLGDGTVKCWGNNGFGQLGNNSTVSGVLAVSVAGLTGASDIAAGSFHTCALVTGSNARCWGSNAFGQLGNNSTTNSSVPVLVGSLTDPWALTAGGEHTCAITPFNETKCWGRNTNGELGVEDVATRTLPATVSLLSNAMAIEAGKSHTCALTAGGLAKCWGRNADGQLGDGSTLIKTAPVAVNNVSLAIATTAGGNHSCAMKADGTVSCWGDGAFGQLGNNATTDRTEAVSATGVAGGVSAKAIATGSDHNCVLRANGTVSCWGRNDVGQVGVGFTSAGVTTAGAVAGLAAVSALTSSNHHTCALIADGTVKCWGNNNDGQLGIGSRVDQPSPVAVPGLSDIVSVQAGGFHTCALNVAGTMQCWGLDGLGQIADAAVLRQLSPVAMPIIRVARLSLGLNHTCAGQADGTLQCRGNGGSGQMGNGGAVALNAAFQAVPGLAASAAVAAASDLQCASGAAGGVTRCWGANVDGQLATGTAGGSLLVPTIAPAMPAGSSLDMGSSHGCAAAPDGLALCWGNNQGGQNGNGLTTGLQLNPTAVLNLSGITAAAASSFHHSCAVRANGAVFCWGFNNVGQLGTGSTGAPSAVPVAVPSFTLNIVPAVRMPSGAETSRRLTVTVVANCEAGDRLQVRVRVTQAGAGGASTAGHGIETAECAGDMASYAVTVVAQGPGPLFAAGAAVAEADAVILNRGDRETQHWTRAVTIAAAPAQ